MKKIILFLLLALPMFAQSGDYTPKQFGFPFAAGNDTIFISDTLVATRMYIGTAIGAINFGVEPSLIGDSASYIDVYCQVGLSGLSAGVPFDSMGVDTLFLGRLDSTTVADGKAIYFQLAQEAWWGFVDFIDFILISPADLDSVYIKSRLRGQ